MVFKSLPFGWKLKTLEDIAQPDYGLVDGPFGSNLPASSYVSSGIPVIRGSNLSLGEVSFKDNEFVYVSEETAKRLARSLCGPEDIVFTKKGTLGQTSFIPKNHRYKQFLISSNQMKLSVNRDVADPRFVYHYVSSPMSREKIIRDSEATGVPKTNLAYLKTFPILLPPLDEQKEVAYILGTLDDKIELNQQMNRTLEGIARALFKSWFIDFDPVRAKLDGRQPYGIDAETAALFPDSFEDSTLGKIPKGWRAGAADDVTTILSGGTPKTSVPEYWNGSIPWFSVKDAPAESDIYVLETEKYITESGVNNSSTQILPVGTTIVSARGTVGRLALVGCPMAMNQSCYGITGKGNYTSFFIYYLMRSAIISLQQQTHGTVFETITRQTFTTVKTVNPPAELAQKFDKAIQPLLQQIQGNLFEIKALSSVRDALLPKLLSGEIRVKDAEQALEAVT